MKHIYLTSSAHTTAVDIGKRLKAKAKNLSLLFIATASEEEDGDMIWLENDRNALIKGGFVLTDFTFTSATQNECIDMIKKHDGIYVSGGNTAYLIQQIQRSSSRKVLRDFVVNRHKIYIGTSAGSIVAGPRCPDYLLEEQTDVKLSKCSQGLKLVDFTVLPHWGSPVFKNKYLGGRLETAYHTNHAPFVVLNDYQYIAIEGDRTEFVTVTND